MCGLGGLENTVLIVPMISNAHSLLFPCPLTGDA